MSDREKCIQLLNSLPEATMSGILQMMNGFVSALNRAETLSAIQECEALLHDPDAKGYTNLDEMWKDLESDEV